MDINEEWEYCQLAFEGSRPYDDHKKKIHGIKCDINLYYLGTDQPGERLCEQWVRDEEGDFQQVWTVNPWRMAIGVLGSLGWELVSVQHANHETGSLMDSNAVAYFKRRKMENRKINEPKFEFPVSYLRVS